MNYRYIKTFFVILTIAIMAFPMLGIAQFDPLPDGGNPDASDAPIDGGLSLLIIAGAGYGVKK